MDSVGAGLLGGSKDLVDHQVALSGGAAAEGKGLVGKAHMKGVAVRICVHRDRLQPGVAAGSDNSDGNFAAVSDQYGAHLLLPFMW